jgi:hypothetical protein
MCNCRWPVTNPCCESSDDGDRASASADWVYSTDHACRNLLPPNVCLCGGIRLYVALSSPCTTQMQVVKSYCCAGIIEISKCAPLFHEQQWCNRGNTIGLYIVKPAGCVHANYSEPDLQGLPKALTRGHAVCAIAQKALLVSCRAAPVSNAEQVRQQQSTFYSFMLETGSIRTLLCSWQAHAAAQSASSPVTQQESVTGVQPLLGTQVGGSRVEAVRLLWLWCCFSNVQCHLSHILLPDLPALLLPLHVYYAEGGWVVL